MGRVRAAACVMGQGCGWRGHLGLAEVDANAFQKKNRKGSVWCPGVDVTIGARAGEGVHGVCMHTYVALGTKPCTESRTHSLHLSLLLSSRSAILKL